MLGEDVEDELGPVDDPGLQRVLERALLHGVELVVDEQHLGLSLVVGALQLFQLALADVRSTRRRGAVLDELTDRLDEGRAREFS